MMKYYPYELLRRITDNFSEERLLGEGGFGRVYKVRLAFTLTRHPKIIRELIFLK